MECLLKVVYAMQSKKGKTKHQQFKHVNAFSNVINYGLSKMNGNEKNIF